MFGQHHFGGTEVDVKKKPSWWRAGQVDHLLLFGTAMPTDGTEVSEADTDLSGSDLARMGQSRAGRRGAKQHERLQARTKA